MARTPVYNVWKQIFQRCENPKCASYKNYGARGIKVCEEWRDFAVFYADMGDCPAHGSLDRIDNSKGYSRENCRWASPRQQHNNKRSNHYLEFRGETHTLTTWARKLGLNRDTITSRLGYGWSVERALSEPVKGKEQTT
jgi:hypothetical protein